MAIHAGIPWDLRRRGSKDAQRHDERLKDALRKNLKELISHEDIISSDGTKRVRIPLRYLDQYRFKEGTPGQRGVGQGHGEPGDMLWQPGTSGSGDGEPGAQPGEHGYETEVDLEMLTRMMLEDLALPWLEAKAHARERAEETWQFTDLRKKGAWSRLDTRRSLRNNALRNARQGSKGVHDLTEDDLRFRVWDIHREDVANAAVYCLMDISGSMTTEKKYIAKCFFFWLVRFIRLKYQHVELVFIVHDTEAELVTEQDFFGRSEGGGTRCSSAYTVALTQMLPHHPAARWNVYLFHFSDGDNLSEDNPRCVTLMEALLRECQQCGYADIPWASTVTPQPSELITALRTIVHPRLVTTMLRTKEDVQAALQAFLGLETLKEVPYG